MQISVGLGFGIGVQRHGAFIDKQHGDDLRLANPCIRIIAGHHPSRHHIYKVSRH